MKNKYLSYLLLGTSLATLLLSGCKPTENNYRQAYDAALAKREKTEEKDIFIPEGGLQSLDGPQKRTFGDITVLYEVKSLRWTQPADVKEGGNVEIDAPRPHKYNVAVGLYKMPTNAASQVEQLIANGYDRAFPAHVQKDQNYAIAASFENIEDAAKFVDSFIKKNKGMNYVGLPGAPVVIETNIRY